MEHGNSSTMKRDKKWNTDERARREAERRKDKHKMRKQAAIRKADAYCLQKEKEREGDIEDEGNG